MPQFVIDAELPCFTRDLKEATKAHPSVIDDLKKAVEEIAQNPRIGPCIPGLGVEVRKQRVGIKKENIGKRGGFRLIYLVQSERVSLLLFYFKPQKANVSNVEIYEAMKKSGLLSPPTHSASKAPTVN